MATVFWNDLRLMLRDRAAFAVMLIAPIVVASLIAGARYGTTEVPRILIPVVNEDGGPGAALVIELLGAHAGPVEMSREAAEHIVAVQNGAPAALVLPAGFSELMAGGWSADVELLTDPANARGVSTVKTLLLLLEKEAAALEDPFAEEMVTMRELNLTGERITRKSYEQNLPGFGLMFILIAVVVTTATGLHTEIRQGTMARLLIAPTGFSRIILAKIGVRWLLGTVQLLVLLLWGHLVFGISLGPSTAALFAVCLLVAMPSAGLGLLVAAVAGSRESALPLALFAVIGCGAIGGLWWPLYIEPPWMRAIAPGFFTTWAMWAMTDLVLRDRTIAEMGTTLWGLAAQGVVLTGLGLILFRRRHSSR
jgi:ABC-2 type transport system permease protein